MHGLRPSAICQSRRSRFTRARDWSRPLDGAGLECAHSWRTLLGVSETKTQRVHLRVAATDDELFRSAAAAAHESLSEFLVESGRERAERLLADRTRFVLPAAEWHAFTVALDRPAGEVPALVELLGRPRPE
jgi:uncharacterized protein (DUF1778 family)